MRKESINAAYAFLRRETKSFARTRSDGEALYLHGNRIAWHNADGSISLTLAGWGTPTTRERLNTLCFIRGKGRPFSQMKHAQYFRGECIDPSDVVTL